MKSTRSLSALAALLALVLTLGACSDGSSDDLATEGTAQPSDETTIDPSAPEGGEGSALAIEDAWVKAADDGMSAAFGVLVNSGDEDVVVTSATSDASPIMELHETVENESGEMIMRPKDGGFVIPAGGEYLLQPGANHLMLMELEHPVKAGDEVSFSLVLEDGSNMDFTAVAKDYSGANERYVEE